MRDKNRDAQGNLYGKESRAKAQKEYLKRIGAVVWQVTILEQDREKIKQLAKEQDKPIYQIIHELLE